MKFDNILGVIGNTPHVRLKNLFPEQEAWIKLEKQNPGGSIKDRIAMAMIDDAEKRGILKPGGTIIEPTSGNTGVGLAMIAAVKGYKVIIVMPESMSLERRRLIALYGAELVLTPREKGMKGAIERAEELQKEIAGAWIPQQFKNPANPVIHAATTAQEIIKDFPNGLDYLITGIGTGGHITGVGRELKKKFPSIQVIGVEPVDSPIISEGRSGPHAIQGI
ncbi:MAG TPA: cysteine synthase family protein, partial [Dysgonamonadaceae bacterium]|nr:cysteine synthase family protein [Dysgonamonadaceae bacterium]